MWEVEEARVVGEAATGPVLPFLLCRLLWWPSWTRPSEDSRLTVVFLLPNRPFFSSTTTGSCWTGGAL